MTSMRALVAAVHYSRRRVLLLAPTSKAVDAAVWESAGRHRLHRRQRR